MINGSGLEPLGRAVLVEMYEPERKKSIIELPQSVQTSGLMLEMRARVIEIGPSCWHDEPRARCEVGDIVMIAKMSGALVLGPKDGKQYRIVNDRDVFTKVTYVEGE